MKEEKITGLERAVAELIQTATTGAQEAAIFIKSELPDVIQQLLAWHFVHALIWFGFGILLLLVCACFTFACLKIHRDSLNRGYIGQGECAIPVLGTLAAVVGALGLSFIDANLGWLQIKIAPKVWLIEYAVGLIK